MRPAVSLHDGVQSMATLSSGKFDVQGLALQALAFWEVPALPSTSTTRYAL